MKVVYCANSTLSSYLIRLFTWSRFSHVAIIEDDTHVIDSTMTHGGVQRRQYSEILEEYTRIEIVDIPVADEQKAMEFARSQLNKPYDKAAILGFVFRRDWADTKDWFCSELVEATIAAGGKPRFRQTLSRITPEMSWAVI